MTSAQKLIEQLAAVVGNVSITDGIATLPDGTALNLAEAVAPGENDEWYRAEAESLYLEDDDVGFDDDSVVRESDKGAFVEAWVWIDAPMEDDAL